MVRTENGAISIFGLISIKFSPCHDQANSPFQSQIGPEPRLKMEKQSQDLEMMIWNRQLCRSIDLTEGNFGCGLNPWRDPVYVTIWVKHITAKFDAR